MIDRRKEFPNQNIEQRYDECTAETVADILGNVFDQAMHPGFIYGAAHHLQNQATFFRGEYPLAAMQSAVLYGVLPSDDNLAERGEDYEADFNNYSWWDKQLARNFVMNGVKSLMSYEEICTYLDQRQMGVALAMTWYSSFFGPLADGTLPSPVGTTSNHCVAVYGYDHRGLQLKVWLGPDYADHGYAYLPRVLFPTIVKEVYAFDIFANRWWNIATIGLTHWGIASDALAELKKIRS